MERTFIQRFNAEPELLSTAPGRINLIGEHTDYNDGYVLPGAIDKKVSFMLARNQTPDHCQVYASNMDETVEFSLKDLKPREQGGWQNYVIGVAAELKAAGATLKGFDAIFEGNVPLGAGLSSSAALECALATGLNSLFDLGFSRQELVKISQMAEHHFAGVECGIMDQFASVMGKENHVFRLDCRSLEYEYFPLNLGDYQLILLDSCVKHSLAGSAYNDRRAECESGVSILKQHYPEIQKLRDVTPQMLEAHREAMPLYVFRRCEHVVNENERVLQACEAMLKGDVNALGQLIYQSHDSLSCLYEVSCPELDFLVNYTRSREYVLGARMMGGGFGGCTLNLIRKKDTPAFIEGISKAYQAETDIQLQSYAVSLSDGAKASAIHV